MAEVKLSALPAAAAPNGTEVVPVVQGGVTKRIPVGSGNGLATLVNGKLDPAQSATIDAVANGLLTTQDQDLAALDGVTLFEPTVAIPHSTFSGALWGRQATGGHGIYKSTDDGTTWTLVNNTLPALIDGVPAGNAQRIALMPDGEIVVNRSLGMWRSTGWATNPATATFTRTLDFTGSSGSQLFGDDYLDNKVVVAEYTAGGGANEWQQSRYVYISLDGGLTYAPIFDKNAFCTANGHNPSSAHLHAACFDPWKPGRVYIAWHVVNTGSIAYTMYSDNPTSLAATWTVVPASDGVTFTTITASKDGIVCGSDGLGTGSGSARQYDQYDGLWRILRRPNDADLKVEPMHLIRVDPGGAGLVAQHAIRASDDSVLVTFESNSYGVFIMGSPDGRRGATLYQSATTYTKIRAVEVTDSGRVHTVIEASPGVTVRHLRSITRARGGARVHDLNSGGILGGKGAATHQLASGAGSVASGTDAIAIGYLASATGTYATAIGRSAVASGADGATAIGRGAQATNSYATAVGFGAAATGNTSIAIGYNARPSGSFSIVIGNTAAVGNTNVLVGVDIVATANGNQTAVGYGASVDLSSSAFGRGATATAVNCIAIGVNAVAALARSTVIGDGLTASAVDQFLIGAKHFELYELAADPAAPAADRGRLYFKDDGAGETRLYVRTSTAIRLVS